MRFAVVLGLAACAGARHTDDAPKGPVYLALFERGRTWSLPMQTWDGHHDRAANTWVVDQTARATVDCRIADVHPVGAAKVSRLACAKPFDDLLAGGAWVATKAGLFHPPTEPTVDDLATYQQGEPLIAAAPEPQAEASDVEESAIASSAFVFEGAWCVREATAAELDRRDYTLCFDARGISGGNELVIIGPDQTWHRARFGKAPVDADDPTGAK